MTYVSAFRRPSEFTSVGEMLQADAEAAGIPLRTLEQVQACITKCRKQKSKGALMARLMINHGRMTNEARAWLIKEFPNV